VIDACCESIPEIDIKCSRKKREIKSLEEEREREREREREKEEILNENITGSFQSAV